MKLQCYHCKRESDIHFRDFFLMQETKTGWQRIKIKDENGTHRWVVLCAKCMELVERMNNLIGAKLDKPNGLG